MSEEKGTVVIGDGMFRDRSICVMCATACIRLALYVINC